MRATRLHLGSYLYNYYPRSKTNAASVAFLARVLEMSTVGGPVRYSTSNSKKVSCTVNSVDRVVLVDLAEVSFLASSKVTGFKHLPNSLLLNKTRQKKLNFTCAEDYV